MIQPDKHILKKHLCLTALGITLQVIGNVCFFAASLGIMKEVNTQIKQALIQELSK